MPDPIDAAIAASGTANLAPTARIQFEIASADNPAPRPCAFEIPAVLSPEEEGELVKTLVMVLHQMRPGRPRPSRLVVPR